MVRMSKASRKHSDRPMGWDGEKEEAWYIIREEV